MGQVVLTDGMKWKGQGGDPDMSVFAGTTGERKTPTGKAPTREASKGFERIYKMMMMMMMMMMILMMTMIMMYDDDDV